MRGVSNSVERSDFDAIIQLQGFRLVDLGTGEGGNVNPTQESAAWRQGTKGRRQRWKAKVGFFFLLFFGFFIGFYGMRT